MLKKCQSFSQKLNVSNSSQKLCGKSFPLLSTFVWFYYFAANILSKIVER